MSRPCAPRRRAVGLAPALVPAVLAAVAVLGALAVLGAPATARADDRVTVAVSYFDNTAKDAGLAPLAKGIADMMITDLAVSSELRVVERARLQEVLGEIALQKQPYFDKRSAARLGRGLGAAYLVTGAYLAARNRLRIDVRVVDVESAAIVFTAAEAGKRDEFFAIQRKLGEKVLAGLGAKLTLLQKKRLGAGNTRSREAFDAYCEALDARDAGDAEREREALKRARAADPAFAKVLQRLDELEKRVATLEKSGGRIIRPSSAREYFHNARIQKAEGDYKGALASLREAALLEPALADVWLLAAELQPRGAFARDALRRDRDLRALVIALQDRDTAALDAALAGSASRARRGRRGRRGRRAGNRHRVYAAAFLYALVHDRLPAKNIDTFAMARRAARELLAAERDGRLARAFIDHLPLVRDVRLTDSKYFDERRSAQVDRPAVVTIADRSEQHNGTPWWRVRATLHERPKSGVEVAIERDLAHPHWRGKPSPPGKHRIFVAYMQYRAKKQQAWDRSKDPNTVIYDLADWTRSVEHDGKTMHIGKLGDRMTVPARMLGCAESDELLTGGYCHADVFVHKNGLPPGFYRVTLRYTDPEGQQVTRVVDTWAGEFQLLPHHTISYPGKKRLVTVLHPSDAEKRKERIVGKRVFQPALMVLVHTYYYASSKGKGDIEHISFDLDYGLRRGKPPETTREWVRYRDQILSSGYKVKAYSDSTFLVLPALPPGAHQLCMATKRTNGSVTPEAECRVFTLE